MSTTFLTVPPRGKTTIAKRSYTEEDIERGLTELALCGGDRRQAAERLQTAGQPISPNTLRGWAERTFPDRYQQIRADRAAKIAERIANEAEDFALELAQAERDTLTAYQAQLQPKPVAERGEDPKDFHNRLAAWQASQDRADKIASSLRNLTTSKSLQVDKVASPLRGRPTQIIEHRDFGDLVKKLSKAQVVEGTAEELEDQPLQLTTAG